MLNDLLALMADGRFHSGERLGSQLGVSRAAIWKIISRLEKQGFPIQRVRGKGYRIPPNAVLLDLDRIQAALPDSMASDWGWHLAQQVDSTNAEAQRRLQLDGAKRIICLSEQQLAGRGRRGRVWASPFGQNIYISVAEPFEGGAQSLEGLSLVVGLALVESLESLGYRGCKLKWPNDVLLDGKKLAGILIELSGDLTSECLVVIGVGVNVLMRTSEIDQPWTSLLMSGQKKELDRNRLIAEFLSRLASALKLFKQNGFEPFMEPWEQRDAWRNQAVRVIAGNLVQEGISRGVTARGALRLVSTQGEAHINGGEVSLRLNNAT
ncbi:bifunctional biotin--[acetyl-CoA-carboxylase] ligase/biotin operon repressor BirA [Pseudomonas sp. gcc21]|uniref:bifunctional biotin--[acetyl-CoA-carboxylase] ligase/biotin operon repressor BirA n=1 Tax=Pseudomonas sp. gcc21 TaxID=2726989 RepID=UPI0014522A0E|nr:bifunctional biotin--[acetyl-CoA-carboxylase] ligase/biotin operon repressor BirA [Pseudomonas sp. gcc21]QJD60106.1 bifunctional biotin--[acetyl-CoA-carboxylase] ligase/biotin operon repressor BirA [Pseudomonas sp. gcc21]